MYHYLAYNLTIGSEFPLPELLTRRAGPVDIMIRCGHTGRAEPPPGRVGSSFTWSDDEAFYYWENVGGFLVRQGSEIIVEAHPGVEERLVRLPLLGTVISAALVQRGLLCLHASGIRIKGGAAAFIGFSGRGKSTMAAALYAHGYTFLGDDLVAVDLNHEQPLVYPGFPLMKIMPEMAKALFKADGGRFERLAAPVPKVGCSARQNFTSEPLPLHTIFVLEEGDSVTLTRLRPEDAVWELLRQTYSFLLHHNRLPTVEAGRNLMRCSDAANRVAVYRLERPRRLDVVGEVIEAIEATVQTDATAQPDDTGRVRPTLTATA